ncbi:hypothetical protein VPNG_06429 [Cytospora leucostoma]|uniref:Carrier domain-containing protein n=1 Tax=Cytospora leucostoma TaxID=1230097 RepID=A0A423WYY3_9PEZI|nr:hypothetical protein VPNG_06429 [Cytospora leucostoma]
MSSSPSISRRGSQATTITNGFSQNDGTNDVLEPLAIIGFGLEYPQDAKTPEGFWRVLKEKRDVMTEWPSDRLNLDAFFYRDEGQKQQKLVAGAHFLTEDLGAFDASFFEISATEAMAMDIQQRKLLEVTYHAFENAGIPMDKFYGSKTGVYSGSMSDDYQQILAKDIDYIPKYSASGVAKTMVANRLSWFYDFHGPSICMDSACSSSLMAFDFACQGLRNRDCNMAVVTGSSLAFAPDGTLSLMKMNFLSPYGRCHSFDDRADGYSRGEGFGVVIIKRLGDAIRDGDTIRAVVRSNGSNQDGHTPGVTQPSREMQAALIRETYTKADLDIADTRFFEAHGIDCVPHQKKYTGTEPAHPWGIRLRPKLSAVSLGQPGHQKNPFMCGGALKSNIGHLEGGSGLAAVIKTVMVLEKGIIPPNANFENLNPSIDADFHNLKFPTKITPWPSTGLRRASIASFGFGGSNSHVVLDDAYHYLSSRGLEGIHSTYLAPPSWSLIANVSRSRLTLNGYCDDPVSLNGSSTNRINGHYQESVTYESTAMAKIDSTNSNEITPIVESPHDRLLILSAADEPGIKRLAEAYESYFESFASEDPAAYEKSIDNLCYTLCARRSSLSWKSYAVVNSLESLEALSCTLSKPMKTRQNAETVFVFTGQGAQYRNMGRSLFSYAVFRDTIERFDEELLQLGCTWSVSDVLKRQRSSVDINDPEISQTTTTALQIALYDLLQVLGVQVSLVVGHSSGEIAAAYASNALSLKSACKVSYYRGKCASSLKLPRAQTPGVMMSVDLSEAEMQKAAEEFMANHPSRGVPYIACVNSPLNVTVSGDEETIDALQGVLDARKVRTRKLNTGVAYHSPHMKAIAQDYASNLVSIEVAEGVKGIDPPIMVSSVSGKYVQDLHHVCTADYWVANLLSPVQFSKAMSVICSKMVKTRTRRLGEPKLDVHDIVEIGPHSPLRRPILDCLEHHGVPQVHSRYHSALSRGSPAIRCVLNLIGELYARGYPVNVQKANEIGGKAPRNLRLLTDLPYYPFNHSKRYWHEPAISRNARLRNGAAIHELLGVPVPDWNPLEPRWRKFFDLNEMPWIGHHQVNGRIIYPAAGMVTMALQGAQQVADLNRRIAAYQIRDAVFTAPISIGKTDKNEVQLHMRLDQAHTDQHTTSLEFRVYCMGETGWFQNCSGNVQVLYQKDDEYNSNSATLHHEAAFYQRKYSEALQRSTINVPKKKITGLPFSPWMIWLGTGEAKLLALSGVFNGLLKTPSMIVSRI